MQNSPEENVSHADGVEETTKSVNPKLLQVFKKLLESNFRLQNDDYLNLLATHLTNGNDGKLTPYQMEAIKRFLVVWLKEYVIQFDTIKDAPTPALLTFVMNITGCICKTEQTFIELNSEDVLERLIKISINRNQPSVITAFIKLLSDFLNHNSGIQWIMSTNHWELIINILNDATIYAYKEGYTFVAKLLQKSSMLNQSFCKSLISYIINPLNKISNTRQITETQNKRLISALRFMSEILVILIRPESSEKENPVISMCIENFELEKVAKGIVNATDNPELKVALYRIIIFLGLYNLKKELSESGNIETAILDVLYEAANDVSVADMLQLLFSTLNCWSNIKKSLPQTIKLPISFEDKLLAIQLMPMYIIFVKTIGFNIYTSDCEDSFRYKFISKLVDKIYPKTIRVKYEWQNHLLNNYSIGNGILCLKYFIHSKQFYSKENAILIFEMMIYLIDDLITTLKEKPELQLQFMNEPGYLELHLKVISVIIDEFELTRRDIAESICILSVVYHLLNEFIWPTKIVIPALKLAEIGISKYMIFHTSFFINDVEGSIIRKLPVLLRAKLHDGAWEVRDSAMELLQSLFVGANSTECTAYRKLLLENDLPSLILKIGTHDGNPFVRASALRCLQKAIQIRELWDELTATCDIYKTIFGTLKTETEGIVRYEAAALVDCIYQHQQIPENIESDFLDAMSHAVIADLHWEVRLKALPFWKKIIDDCLAQQELTDGSFPSEEIQKRLVEVLYNLSDIGCLFVFYEALRDECDIEVSKCATEIIKDFVNLLKERNVTVDTLQLYKPSTSITPINKTSKEPHKSSTTQNENNTETPQKHQISDAILEDILDTRDLNLLETVYNTANESIFENIETKERKALQPELFLDLVYTDLESRLNDKTTWVEQINDFESLLDDILKEYEFDDVNSLDCY